MLWSYWEQEFLVPFGRMKNLEEGYIVNIKQHSEYEVKEIATVQEKYLDIRKNRFCKMDGKKVFL